MARGHYQWESFLVIANNGLPSFIFRIGIGDQPPFLFLAKLFSEFTFLPNKLKIHAWVGD